MKRDPGELEEVLGELRESCGELQYVEIAESAILEKLQIRAGSRTDAAEIWEYVAAKLRRPTVLDGRVYEWNLFRKVVCVTRLPGGDEVERIAEMYALSTPQEVDRRIRGLSGIQFEHFLGELLRRIPSFRSVVV